MRQFSSNNSDTIFHYDNVFVVVVVVLEIRSHNVDLVGLQLIRSPCLCHQRNEIKVYHPSSSLVCFFIFYFLILRGKSAASCFASAEHLRSQPCLTAALSIDDLDVKL